MLQPERPGDNQNVWNPLLMGKPFRYPQAAYGRELRVFGTRSRIFKPWGSVDAISDGSQR